MEKQLTFKQQRFSEEYPKDSNATQAAIRAGYSEKTARSIGQRLLTNVDIVEAIARQYAILRERCAVSVETLTAELENARVLAMSGKAPSAAVSAIMGKAKLHGLLIDRKDFSGGLTMTHEERLAQLEGDEPVPVP